MYQNVQTVEATTNQSAVLGAETHFKNGKRLKIHKSRGNILRKACFALFAAFIIFNGCDDKEDEPSGNTGNSAFDGKITAKVENWNDYKSIVSKVSVDITKEDIVFGTVTNDGFSLTLPKTINDGYLDNIDLYSSSEVKISDMQAHFFEVWDFYIEGYNSDDEYVGRFKYMKENTNLTTSVSFFYVDRDVTITGSDKWNIFNVSLKKGWNKVYTTEDDNGGRTEISTKEVSGLKWYFEPYD